MTSKSGRHLRLSDGEILEGERGASMEDRAHSPPSAEVIVVVLHEELKSGKITRNVLVLVDFQGCE